MGKSNRMLLATATVAAASVPATCASAAVVSYSLLGTVGSAFTSTLVGEPMFVHWSVDSADISVGPYYSTAPVLSFEFGVEGTAELWTGTGGEFRFSASEMAVELFTSSSVYTGNGSFVAGHAHCSYKGFPLVTAFDYDGLPSGFSFAHFNVNTTLAFIVTNDPNNPNPMGIVMSKTSGLSFAASEIPEPGTAAMLGLGALALVRQRRRGKWSETV